jgi:hypothetical protein
VSQALCQNSPTCFIPTFQTLEEIKVSDTDVQSRQLHYDLLGLKAVQLHHTVLIQRHARQAFLLRSWL